MAASELIVVGGPNGAGKSTFAEEYVASLGYDYLGADAIALELCSHDPASVPIDAGREFLRRIDEALARKQSFIVESTLSGRTFQRVLKKAQAEGFQIAILYLWLDSVETGVARVRERVLSGGHNVPEEDIRRRFLRSLWNFWNLYRPLADQWSLIYNSNTQPITVAIGGTEQVTIRDGELYALFQSLVGEDC